MTYKTLPAAEQAAAIRRRLQGLERDHLEASLDVEISPNGNSPQAARVAELEKTIEKLSHRADQLEKSDKG